MANQRWYIDMKKPKIVLNAKAIEEFEQEMGNYLSDTINTITSENSDKSDSTIVTLIEAQLKEDRLIEIDRSEISRLVKKARGDDHNGR